MKATTIAKTPPPGVTTETLVKDAIELMHNETGCAVGVIEGDKLVGTLTKNDVLKRVVADGRDPATTKVSEVMSPSPLTAGPDINTEDALKLMFEKKRCFLPIVEENGKLVSWLAICHLFNCHMDMLTDEVDTLTKYIGADGPGG